MCSSLNNKRLVKGIKQASPIEQTSCLKGFHSVLNQFSPKMIGYTYWGMFCRYVYSSTDEMIGLTSLLYTQILVRVRVMYICVGDMGV